MTSLRSLSLQSPFFLVPSPSRVSTSPSFLRTAGLLRQLPARAFKSTTPRIITTIRCSSSAPSSKLHSIEEYNNDNIKDDEQQAALMFEALKQSENKGILPSVRTYENDLAKLTVVGSVNLQQALTASAADGGEAANQHLVNGLDAMVVETVYPGREDEHSTISTRLFLPARKVKEKAKSLRTYLTEDILSNTTSKNILAMTFRQVQVQQLWNFELVLFVPGSGRDMETLDSAREQVPVSFTLTSNSKSVLSVLAEVICILALESTEREFHKGSSRNGFFSWFSKTKRISSKDSSVSVYKLEEEITGNAKSILEKFNIVKAKYQMIKKSPRFSWWTSLLHSTLESIGGLDFSTWAGEYIPAYRLEIDVDRHSDLKFVGWKRNAMNKWEALLTPSQMAGLANILDLYLEDPYTLSDKHLSCGVTKSSNKWSNKRGSSWLHILSTTLVSVVFVVCVGALGQICFPHLPTRRKDVMHSVVPQSSDYTGVQIVSLDDYELEAFCTAIIRKIKDSYGWTAEMKSESTIGAWIGKLPIYLRKGDQADCNDEGISIDSESVKQGNEIYRSSAQDIASYQVVLSPDGKIIGFQPTSRVAVNHWAANPLAKELHGGKKLSPGILEPWLRISKSEEVIVLELLISVNPDTYFALARPAS